MVSGGPAAVEHARLRITCTKRAQGPKSLFAIRGLAMLSPAQTVGLAGCFSNPRKLLRALIRRVLRGAKRSGSRPPRQEIEDARGPVTSKSPVVQTRLNAQSRAELLDSYAAGVPVRELAERFRVHRGTVWALACRAGLAPRNGPELPQHVRDEAVDLYASGLSLLKVGRQLGIGDETVRTAVLASGGTLRPRGWHTVSSA